MPNNTVELILKVLGGSAAASDLRKVSGELDGMGRIAGMLKGGLAAIGGALTFDALYQGAKRCVTAYAEQEAADLRLAAAMKQRGVYSERAIAHAKDLAGEMQNLTGVEDDQIEAAQRQLVQFGLTGAAMDKALKSSLDLAAGLDIDLGTAATMVGKAFKGQTETLGRYGLKVDESIPKNERFATVMKQVEERFGGAAQAKMAGAAGQMARLRIAVSELSESLGGDLTPALEQALTPLTDFINWVTNEGLPGLRGFGRFFDDMAAKFPGIGTAIKNAIWPVILVFKSWAYVLGQVKAGLEYMKKYTSPANPQHGKGSASSWAAGSNVDAQGNLVLGVVKQPAASGGGDGAGGSTGNGKSAAELAAEAEEKRLAALTAQRSELQSYLDFIDAKIAADLKEAQEKERLRAEARESGKAAWREELELARAAAEEKKRLELEVMESKVAVAQQATALAGQIYELSGKKSKEAFIAWKVGAIAEAMISAQLAALKAMDAPWPFGPILAGLTYANAIARVATIRAQTYALGGPVGGWSPHSRADNIPARLTAGEYVQPVDAVQYYGGGVMEALRRRLIPRNLLAGFGGLQVHVPAFGGYADGGSVSPGSATIVNFFDRREFEDFLGSSAGRNATFNLLSSDPARARRALGIK